MMTVNEVSKLSGVSIRALHLYDEIGLLKPAQVTDAGYRLYDDASLERLQIIMLFKELQFPLRDIKEVLDNDSLDKAEVIESQIKLLELKKERLENLIDLAGRIKNIGVGKMSKMSFEVFDTKKIDEYAAKAKEKWGGTDAYKEYEDKSSSRSSDTEKNLGMMTMEIFAEFGRIINLGPESDEASELVIKLKDHFSKNYYQCTDQILESLGQMYAAGGEMTDNIDSFAGSGTAEFANNAIKAYLLKK